MDAVTTGLVELARYGFLRRARERNPDGSLGAAMYVTDLPVLQDPMPRPDFFWSFIVLDVTDPTVPVALADGPRFR